MLGYIVPDTLNGTEVFQAMARKLGTRGNSPEAPHWWHGETESDLARRVLGLMNLEGVWVSLESLRDSHSVHHTSL